MHLFYPIDQGEYALKKAKPTLRGRFRHWLTTVHPAKQD
jgi:hypothetical protein